MIFSLMQIGNDLQFNAVWHRSSVAVLVVYMRLAESGVTVTLSVTCMDSLCWWYNHLAHVVSFSTVLVFLTNMSEKFKSKSPSAFQVKNWWKIIGTEKKLDIISWLEESEWMLTYAIRLASLIIAYVQFVIMLIELKKVLSQELKFLCSKTITVLWEWTVPRTTDVSVLHFYCVGDK